MTKALDPAEKARRAAAREAAWEKAREAESAKRAALLATRAARSAKADLAEPVAADLTPEQLPDVLDAASDPLSTIAHVAKRAGLNEKEVRGLLAKVRAQYAPLLGELKAVKTDDLIRLTEDRAWMAVEMIDRQSLADMNAYQRAIIFGVLIDKARILKGLPTHIVSVEDRRQLDTIAGLLLKEMERRGMSVDNRGEMIDITPGTVDEFRSRQAPSGTDQIKINRAEAREESGEAGAIRDGAPS